MADYTDSKLAPGEMHPQNAMESPWGRLEPLITPDQLVERKLWGIPLISAWRSPGLPAPKPMSNDMLKDIIRRMVTKVEVGAKIVLMPIKFHERLPFDKQEFDSYGYFQLKNRPVFSVDKLAIQDTNNNDIFQMPAAWISMAYATRGRLNIIPLSPAQSGAAFSSLTGTFGTMTMSLMMGGGGNYPAFFTCEYTAGFPDGMLPTQVNELIAIEAALEVLGILAPTYARSGSHSLGVDGLSQSITTPGAELFQIRMKELQESKKETLKQLKGVFGRNIIVGTL